MASRLSELSVKSSFDKGHAALPWRAPAKDVNLIKIDLDRVLASANPQALIQSLPPQLLYHSIKSVGLEASAEAIAILSNDQFTRLLDYDVWLEGSMEAKSLFAWLLPLRTLGPIAMARRFCALEEEYQLAALDKKIRVYDAEEYESLPDSARETLTTVPGAELHYQILVEDPDLRDVVTDLVDSVVAMDLKYALSLLSHAAYNPPNEAEFTLLQFRNARLEEDGFLTEQESRQAFMPVDLDAMKHSWSLSSKIANTSQLVLSAAQAENSYVEAVVFHALNHNAWTDDDGLKFQQGTLYLANCLCSVAKIEPSDTEGLNKILEHAKALIGLGLEVVCQQDLDRAVVCLKSEVPQRLFRAGLTVVYNFQKEVLEKLAPLLPAAQIDKLRAFSEIHKWGEAQWLIDTQLREALGLQLTESLKGLFNRFPMGPEFKELHGLETIEFIPFTSIAVFYRMQQNINRLISDLENRQ